MLCLVADAEQADGGQIAFPDERGEPPDVAFGEKVVRRAYRGFPHPCDFVVVFFLDRFDAVSLLGHVRLFSMLCLSVF